MPPVAAQRCCRVETIGGLTGLLHRTLKNKNNNKITMVRIALVIIAIMVIVIQRCSADQIPQPPVFGLIAQGSI